MPFGFPTAVPGQAIGLLGGSFDPAHEGHVHITKEALKRFGLARVWWLVSPTGFGLVSDVSWPQTWILATQGATVLLVFPWFIRARR